MRKRSGTVMTHEQTSKIRRAAIYARFSSELQSPRSIDDQIRLCRSHSAKLNSVVVSEYFDRAQTGASVVNRQGLKSLMTAALSGSYDIIIVEALDRLSRDQEDLASIYKRLSFAGVSIETVHEGAADVVQIGIRGLVGQLYLQDLGHKIRRGQVGSVAEGKSPGGKAYGYSPVLGAPGELQIVGMEADVVRRIFKAYSDGRSAHEIALELNRGEVPAPRSTHWTANTINGHAARGHGILRNSLYVGTLVWNRVRMVRNPITGRRVSRVNPEAEWLSTEVPELQIVEQEIWDDAQERLKSRRHDPTKRRGPKGRKPYLLKGLLKCGLCGGSMTIADHRAGKTRVECGNSKRAGICSHKKRYGLHRIEETVLTGLADALNQPHYVREYVEVYRAEMARLSEGSHRRYRDASRSIDKTNAAIDRLIIALSDDRIPSDLVGKRIEALEMKRAEAEKILASRPDDGVIALHPQAVDNYQKDLQNLSQSLAESVIHDEEAKKLFRSLIGSVKVLPANDGFSVDVSGHLPRMQELWGSSLVAEEGLEPPTRGL